jgi:hypothetical protein
VLSCSTVGARGGLRISAVRYLVGSVLTRTYTFVEVDAEFSLLCAAARN